MLESHTKESGLASPLIGAQIPRKRPHKNSHSSPASELASGSCTDISMKALSVASLVSSLFLSAFWMALQHMEVPRLGVESELQLSPYATATATPDLNGICNLHHSSRQLQSLNLLSGARDRMRILMDTSQVLNPFSHKGNFQVSSCLKGTSVLKGMELRTTPPLVETLFYLGCVLPHPS